MSETAAVGEVVDLVFIGRCESASLRKYRERVAAAPAVGALSCSAQFVAQLASAS